MATVQDPDFDVVTVVWGERYIDLLLRTTVPSLLAPGNLPALCAQHKVEFVIHTSTRDAKRLATEPGLGPLRALLPVRIVPSDDEGVTGKYGRATAMHRAALIDAQARQRGVVFVTPDAIWADGVLARVGEIARAGYRAVVIDGPRVSTPAFFATLAERTNENGGSISIGARELARLTLQFAHPYDMTATWGADQLHDTPYFLHWPVRGEGVLTRGFCRFPLMLIADNAKADFTGAIDHGLVGATLSDLSKVYYCSNSDEFMVASLQGEGASAACFKPRRGWERALRIAQWSQRQATPQNLGSALHAWRWHGVTASEAKWRRAERRSARHLALIDTVRVLLNLRDALKEQGLNRAAQLLAYALQTGQLPRLGSAAPTMDIFAPTDAAFDRLGDEQLNHLVAERSAFRALLSAHVTRGTGTEGGRFRIHPIAQVRPSAPNDGQGNG